MWVYDGLRDKNANKLFIKFAWYLMSDKLI